jgi:hypothetical protein
LWPNLIMAQLERSVWSIVAPATPESFAGEFPIQQGPAPESLD